MEKLRFDQMGETDFEEFCVELLSDLDHVVNVHWRKGTPKQASPAHREAEATTRSSATCAWRT